MTAPETPPAERPLHIISMGVSGSGKTSLAKYLSEHYGIPYAEGDDFHSDEARAKMASGVSLTDEDRWPWLERLRDWMSQQAAAGNNTVVTCSALKGAYRDILRQADGDVVFLHLTPTRAINARRMAARTDHYMPPSLLQSQVDTLEALRDDEDGFVYVNDGPQEETRQVITDWLEAHYPREQLHNDP